MGELIKKGAVFLLGLACPNALDVAQYIGQALGLF